MGKRLIRSYSIQINGIYRPDRRTLNGEILFLFNLLDNYDHLLMRWNEVYGVLGGFSRVEKESFKILNRFREY